MAKVSPCDGFWAPEALSYFTAILSAILSGITIVGNALIVFAVVKDPYKKLRSPFMYFLFSLAVSDLIVGAVTLPTSTVTHTMEAHGTKQTEHVMIIQLSYFISSTGSILHLAALGIDRYFAVTKAVMYRAKMSLSRCLLISVAIWILSVSLPFLYFIVGYMNYLMIFAHTSIILTLFILLYTYRNVYRIMKEQIRKLHSNNPVTRTSSKNRAESSKKKLECSVTRAYVLILVFYIICYSPAIVSIYILNFCFSCNCNLRHVLRDLQFLCVVSNSSINPFVCSIRLKPFRNALKASFGLRCFRKESYTVNETTDGTKRTRTITSTSEIGVSKVESGP